MFIIILVSIAKHKRHLGQQTQSKADYKYFKESFVIALSLAVVFGLGWGIGLLATSYPVEAITITFQIIFSIFVGAQGILLFLLHGIRNSDARHTWKNWFTSFSTSTRLSYLVTSTNKVSTARGHAANISQSGSATLPRTLPHKVDLSRTEQSMGSEPVYHEIGEEVKQDLSRQPAPYEEFKFGSEFSFTENMSYGLVEKKNHFNAEAFIQEALNHYEFMDQK